MRSRVTITISTDLLDQIDQKIDHKSVRNRSQAIEALLRQVVTPQVSTAVILAGGSNIKHPQFAEELPAALVPIKGKPVIEHTLQQLRKYGFTEVLICTSVETAPLIRQALRKFDLGKLKVRYSEESQKLGTGGALRLAASKIASKPFLLMHGDVLTDINLSEFVSFFIASKARAVIAIKPRPGRLSYGRVYLEGSTVIDFKVPKKATPISLVNTGIYLFDNSVLKLLPEAEAFKLEETLIPELVKKGEVAGSVFQGIWFDVSEEDSYNEANLRWPE